MATCDICYRPERWNLDLNEAELARHLENAHHIPVPREGESEEQTIERFLGQNPGATSCLKCFEAKRPWVTWTLVVTASSWFRNRGKKNTTEDREAE